jgi:hypothetical protein
LSAAHRVHRPWSNDRPGPYGDAASQRHDHVDMPVTRGLHVARACPTDAARVSAIRRRRVSSRAQARHEAGMPTSSGRKKSRSPRGASGTRRSRPPPVALWRAVVRFVWELLPPILLLCVVLAAFLADPAALARVIWTCLSGAFGRSVQLGAAVLSVAAVGMVAWAFWPEPSAPPPRRRAGAGTGRRRTAAPSMTPDSALADPAQSRRRSTGSRTAKSACGGPAATPVAQSAVAEPLPPKSGTSTDARTAGKRRRSSPGRRASDIAPQAERRPT